MTTKIRVRISGRASDAVLGGGAAGEMGVAIVATSKTTETIEADRATLVRLADEFFDRARGGEWSGGDAGERAACRRAAKAIAKVLDAVAAVPS